MKMIRLALAALVLSALPAAASTPSAPPASVRSIEAAQPASVPAPAPNTKMFSLTAMAMAVGATSAAKGSKSVPSADQIMQANARGINVVSRTGEGEPDAEDYTVALATGSSIPNPVLSAAAQRANAPQNVGKSLGELAMMTEEELKEEADARGVKVVSSTSTVDEAGNATPSPISRADLIKALSSGPNSGKMDETVPGGKYKNASGQWVNAHGQKINEDGTMKDPNEVPRTGAEQPY